jgi:hypothetical protein
VRAAPRAGAGGREVGPGVGSRGREGHLAASSGRLTKPLGGLRPSTDPMNPSTATRRDPYGHLGVQLCPAWRKPLPSSPTVCQTAAVLAAWRERSKRGNVRRRGIAGLTAIAAVVTASVSGIVGAGPAGAASSRAVATAPAQTYVALATPTRRGKASTRRRQGTFLRSTLTTAIAAPRPTRNWSPRAWAWVFRRSTRPRSWLVQAPTPVTRWMTRG